MRRMIQMRLIFAKVMVRKKIYFLNTSVMMGLFFAAQAERFASGMPTEQFAKIARKEIKHKL